MKPAKEDQSAAEETTAPGEDKAAAAAGEEDTQPAPTAGEETDCSGEESMDMCGSPHTSIDSNDDSFALRYKKIGGDEENSAGKNGGEIVKGDSPMTIPTPQKWYGESVTMSTPELYLWQSARANVAKLDEDPTPIKSPGYPVKRRLVFESPDQIEKELENFSMLRKTRRVMSMEEAWEKVELQSLKRDWEQAQHVACEEEVEATPGFFNLEGKLVVPEDEWEKDPEGYFADDDESEEEEEEETQDVSIGVAGSPPPPLSYDDHAYCMRPISPDPSISISEDSEVEIEVIDIVSSEDERER
jgi:hypothetical protein